MSFDFNQTLTGQHLIEASAGTGKTHLLTTLYLRLLLGLGTYNLQTYDVSEILVVTFTIAATKELKNRIRQRIKTTIAAIADGQSNDAEIMTLLEDRSAEEVGLDLERLKQALLSFDEAQIHTIHGFCARVLKDASFSAGTLFDQTLDAHPSEILNSAAQDVFRNLLVQSKPVEQALTLSIWPTPEALVDAMAPLLNLRNLRYQPEPATEAFSDGLVERMSSVKQQWINANLSQILRDSGLKKTVKAWHRIDQMRRFCETPALTPESELWHIWTASALARAMKKNESPPRHPVFDELEVISEALNPHGPMISRIWHTTLDQFRSRVKTRRAEGRLTVDDLLTVLRDAVTETPDLAIRLNQSYPAILVDEFQDTDHQQYEIFSGIHAAVNPHLLMLIGDPKQSIYRFRGADIFTYLDAKTQSNYTHQLDTNWRATPQLIDATNHLFDQPGCFTQDGGIGFFPSFAAKPFNADALTLDGQPAAPFWWIGDDPTFEPRRQQIDNHQLAQLLAQHIAQWLSGLSLLKIEGRPIEAKQIAVLTRNRSQADLINRALNARGLGAVYLTQDNVLEQNTAKDVVLILEAVMAPANEQKILSALATELLQSTPLELEQFRTSEPEQFKVKTEFERFDRVWKQRGIAACILSLIKERRLAKRWLGQDAGARQLTNLRHLAELLETQSAKLPGRAQLVSWLTQDYQRDEALIDDVRQLRLESDDNLIKIMTLHGSKGLEFDIVCLPFAHFSSTVSNRNSEPSVGHQQNAASIIEPWINIASDPGLTAIAEREALEEDRRLLYVALTRAKYLNVVGLGCPNHYALSTMSRLLGLTDTDEPIEVLKRLPSNLFRLAFDPFETVANVDRTSAVAEGSWLPAQKKPVIEIDWRLHSYTRMIKSELRETRSEASTPGFTDDDIEPPDPTIASSSSANLEHYVTQIFPRGPHVGIAMHHLMEHLDFKASIVHQQGLLARVSQRLNLDEDSSLHLNQWLEAIVHHPLTPSGLKLNDLPREDRVDELEFHFPVHSASNFVETAHALGFLDQIEDAPLHLEGMMTGSIDLVCRHEGRYYLIDYKTNHLGDSKEDYDELRLEAAMTHHHYDLQYLIYAVALKKLLALREPNFAFHRHFGGVIYLFLRGMTGSNQHGIYFRALTPEIVTQLESALGGEG